MKTRLTALLLALAVPLSLLCGCGSSSAGTENSTQPPAETAVSETIPAGGDPGTVTCLGSYTVSGEDITAAADTVIATMDGAGLTLGQLQVYYWLQVAAYRQNNPGQEPDFSRPLDVQVCRIDSTVNSWQQYFLREALNAWHAQQALLLHAAQTKLPTEEAYQPDPGQYAKYMPEVPALQYLYGCREHYQPNELHQAYLDALPETLAALAESSSFAGADALAKAIAGPGASEEDLLSYAQNANLAYMYFTELGYGFSPTEGEISAYYDAHKAELEAAGIVRDGEKNVSVRHILLIPEGAETANDGTVTAAEESWNACLARANALLEEWDTAVRKTRYASQSPNDPAEARFAEFARQHSADAGSSRNGGLYVNLHRGQLVQALDDWCFDAARQHGDVEILRSPCGYHILFFSDSTESWYAAAEAGLTSGLYSILIQTVMDTYPMTVNYSAIRLGQAEDSGVFLTPSGLLYPDIAHERYPSIPLYIQQDYADTKYGYYKLSSHGCGICVLAMAASYMTDEEITPPELAAQYGYYCGKNGSDVVLIDDTPAEMGFHVIKRTHDWGEIDNALKNGQPVASLQHAGYWTRSGHFILIAGITDDGKYVVRDSHLPNYGRIPAFAEDCHTRNSLSAAGQFFWIFAKKVTTIPACVRCGGEEQQAVPAGLFREDYHCAKCLTAMARRDIFLSSPAG